MNVSITWVSGSLLKIANATQKDRSLEIHTREFLELAHQTYYLEHSLCLEMQHTQNEWAHLPGCSPQNDFTTCVEWVLVNNNLAFTIGLTEPSLALPDLQTDD